MKGKRGERCANLSPSGSGPLVPGLFVVPVVVAERHVDQAFDETFHIFCSQRERERERERQRQRERELNKVEGMAGNVIFVINAFTDKLGRDTCSHGIHNSFELFVKRDSLIVLENIKFRSFISIIVFFFFNISFAALSFFLYYPASPSWTLLGRASSCWCSGCGSFTLSSKVQASFICLTTLAT
jgi:hypothetical protein